MCDNAFRVRPGKVNRVNPGGILESIVVEQPFEQVGIDILGPFPRSAEGNEHIVVAVDYLTK